MAPLDHPKIKILKFWLNMYARSGCFGSDIADTQHHHSESLMRQHIFSYTLFSMLIILGGRKDIFQIKMKALKSYTKKYLKNHELSAENEHPDHRKGRSMALLY